jgi:uncharacterized protein YciI
MLFAFICTDKPGHQDVRIANRPAHVDFLKANADKMFAAGPLQTDDGEGMTGSILIFDFPDRAAAEAFAAEDPYAKADLFESVVIKRWKKVFPADPS